MTAEVVYAASRGDCLRGLTAGAAGRAQALRLDGEAVQRESGLVGARFDRLRDGWIVQFDRRLARRADQELRDVPFFRPVAADEGVEALDLVHQPLVQQLSLIHI